MRYHRLLSRLYNTPLAIAQSKLDVLTSNVTIKLLAGESVDSISPTERQETTSSVPVIKVFDSLVSKNGGGDSGSTSYEAITRQIQQVAAEGHKQVIFYIDSPGGEVSGLFGLASFINSLSSKYGIETIAVTDGMATSAAYVIASAADKVYATSSSIIGSIGVIMTLVNVAEADKAKGIEYTILRSKDEKALANPHEPTSDKVVADAKKMLATLDEIMNSSVTSYRPKLTLETILKLNGNTVLAEEALNLGLIDGIVSSVEEVIKSKKTSSTTQFSTTKGATMATTFEEAQAEVVRLSSELTTLKASTSLEVAKAKQEEQGRILGILDAAKTFGLSSDVAIKRIKAGTSIEDTVGMFEDMKEMLQMANPVDSTVGATSTINSQIVPPAKQEEGFVAELMSAFEALDKQPKLELR